MTAFKKTILGKILGGVAKVALPIVAGITGLGAISGAAKGVGAIAGVASEFGKVKSGISAVATKAMDLITGDTKAERDAIKAQKEITAADAEKIDFANKLMKAGASQASAYAQAGILTDATGTPIASNEAGMGKTILIGGAVIGGIYLLAKALKIIK